MMTYLELAHYLAEHSAELSHDNEGRLRVQLLKGGMTDTLRAQIAHYKGDLILWCLRREELPKFEIYPANWSEGCTIYACRLNYIGLGTHRSHDGLLWCDACTSRSALWDQAHSMGWPQVWTQDIHISVGHHEWTMKEEWWYFIMTATEAETRKAKYRLDVLREKRLTRAS